MNKKIKLTALIMVISITMLFTGCSTSGNDLFSAFSKQNSIKTMENNTNIKVALDIEGLTAEQQNDPEMQKVLKLLNNSNLKIKGKTIQNEDKTISQNQSDISVDLNGTSINTKMWSDIDFTKETPVERQIFKIPEILSVSLPSEYKDKDYLVNDIWKSSSINPAVSPESIRKIVDITRNFQSTMRDFIKVFVANSNLGFEVVKSQGTKVIDGQTVSVYQIKLDNASLKALVKYTVNGLLDNKMFMDILKSYFTEIIDSQAGNSTTGEAGKELSKLIMNFDSTFSIVKLFINKLLDTFQNVDFLGHKGIVIDYAVNKDGYIINESGTVDLNFDINSIYSAIAKLNPSRLGERDRQYPVVKMCFEFNTDTTNINQDMAIKFPEVNENNSIDYTKVLKSRNDLKNNFESKLIQ